MSRTVTETQTTVERWTVDPSRTTVEFEVEHLWGLHSVRGRFNRFDGSYVVGPAGDAIRLTIDAASVDTGVATRDKHLRSADFFDVDRASAGAVHIDARHRTGKRTRARERRTRGGGYDAFRRVRRVGARGRAAGSSSRRRPRSTRGASA